MDTTLTRQGDALAATPSLRRMLNKVPEVTLYFWIIKILCTTVGETAADYLNSNLGLGLTGTTLGMSAFLIVVLFFQFRLRTYLPSIYWLAVVLISVVGTLITDDLTDGLGISLVYSTIAFAIALGLTFAVWFASERTLSIHTIVTTRREAFYWARVLFTFALGTAAGDLTAERLAVGYWKSALLFGAVIALVFFAHSKLGFNAILAFWIAYILTRPLGASIGDYMSQAKADGGLALGTTVTSAIFLSAILVVVVYLTLTKLDRIELEIEHPSGIEGNGGARVLVVANRVAATRALVEAVRGRAAAGAAKFFVLIPNPAHLPFDGTSHDTHDGEALLAQALPLLEAAAEDVEGGVATSPNAYDDILQELNTRKYDEIILETPPSHPSHWLHA